MIRDLAQWSKYSPIEVHEAAGSIPQMTIFFSHCITYVFTKNKYKSLYTYRLSRIHNTALASTYFGQDNSEC
jgi:hypothetical protein